MKERVYLLVGIVVGALLGVYLVGAQSDPATELTADHLIAHDNAGNKYQIKFGEVVIPPTQEMTPIPTATPGSTAIPKPTETPNPDQACQAKVIVTRINVRTLPDTAEGQVIGQVAFNDLIGVTAKHLNKDGYNWFEFYWSPAVPNAWVAYQRGSDMYMEWDQSLPACQGLPEVNPFP